MFCTKQKRKFFLLSPFVHTRKTFNEEFIIIEILIKDLNRDVAYQKTTDFFIKIKGLHSYFERNGGRLSTAIVNAKRSMDEIKAGDRTYTYSELGRLIERLRNL